MDEKEYVITIFNNATQSTESVVVPKEVYDEYRRGKWRIDKNDQKHARELPFSALIGSEDNLYNFHEIAYTEDFIGDLFEDDRKNLAKKALEELSETMRRRYVLHHYNKLRYKDIAQLEGVSEYSVKESIKNAQRIINLFLKKVQKKIK